MSTHRSLFKSSALLGFLTALSRILGFVRDLVIATAFGTGLGAEAFVVSFKIPNLLRDLVGEGAMNSAFVPVLTECHEKKRDEFWGLVSTLFFALSLILVLLSFLGILFAGPIAKLLAPGFLNSSDIGKFPLTVRLTRFIFPYIFLIGLSALAMGVLNALREFTSSALGPVFLNISMIFFGIFFEKSMGPMALVLGVLCGGVLQVACQIPPLLKSGFRIQKPAFDTIFVRKIGRLLIPRALGSAVYQINVFVDSILASFESVIGPGGQSALYYSNRLFQLPLAIFGVSLAQAILPTFSTQLVREDIKAFKETFSVALRSLMIVVMPASVGLAVLSKPIVRIIFEHGRFNAYSTSITASALFYYSFGLLSCSLVKILANAFYSMQDTKTPVKTMAFSVMLNILLSLVLMRSLKIGGLALASSVSATVNVVLLYTHLRKRVGELDGRRMLQSFGQVLLLSAAMGLFCLAYNFYVLTPHQQSPQFHQALYLAAGIVLSIFFYFGMAYFFKIKEVRKLIP